MRTSLGSLQATFPWGGHLRWTYATDPYSGSRNLRAVSARYLAADSAGVIYGAEVGQKDIKKYVKK